MVGWVIWNLPTGTRVPIGALDLTVAYASLVYPVFYLAVSWVVTINSWRKRIKSA